MNINKLELLPNELWLLIFGYLSSFDLFQAFFDIENKRIRHMLMSRSLIFNTQILSYTQMNNIVKIHEFFTLLRTIILDDSCSSLAFYDFWTTVTSPVYITPSIERLIIKKTEHYADNIVNDLIKPLSFGNTLQYLHLTFESVDSDYTLVLTDLAKTQSSVPTMILEVQKGML